MHGLFSWSVLQRGHQIPVRGVPAGKLFLDPDRQLRSVRRGHISESDGADELQELYCGVLLRGGGQAQVRPMRVGLPLRVGPIRVHPMYHRVPVS